MTIPRQGWIRQTGRISAILCAQGYEGRLSIEPHSANWQGELGEKGLDYTIRYFRALEL